MERKIVESLLAWKDNPDKLPLLLHGARQVGKTYTLLSFGKRH
jgi:predicted AAA+ superfamily ATPase